MLLVCIEGKGIGPGKLIIFPCSGTAALTIVGHGLFDLQGTELPLVDNADLRIRAGAGDHRRRTFFLHDIFSSVQKNGPAILYGMVLRIQLIHIVRPGIQIFEGHLTASVCDLHFLRGLHLQGIGRLCSSRFLRACEQPHSDRLSIQLIGNTAIYLDIFMDLDRPGCPVFVFENNDFVFPGECSGMLVSILRHSLRNIPVFVIEAVAYRYGKALCVCLFDLISCSLAEVPEHFLFLVLQLEFEDAVSELIVPVLLVVLCIDSAILLQDGDPELVVLLFV